MSGGDSPAAKVRLTLVDAFQPQIKAGKFEVGAALGLDAGEKGQRSFQTAGKSLAVAAPRFALGPDDLYARYPPDGATGAFHDTLPHVVLARPTLPWERPAAAGDEDTPWMALILIDQESLERLGADGEPAITVESCPVSDMWTADPEPGVWRPTLTKEPWDDEGEAEAGSEDGQGGAPGAAFLRLQLPGEDFRKVAPRWRDLPFFAHGRSAPSRDKDPSDILPGDRSACIVADRPPREGRETHAFLISLEGLAPLFEMAEGEMPAKVNLVVLARWRFTALGSTLDEKIQDLVAGAGAAPWLAAVPPDGASEAVAGALGRGYVPLAHQLRTGERTVSWYRGPLAPAPQQGSTLGDAHAAADALLMLDETSGMFDASLAAAWQLGRLLALHRPEAVEALVGDSQERLQQLVIATAEDEARVVVAAADEGGWRDLVGDDLFAALLHEFWPALPGEEEAGT